MKESKWSTMADWIMIAMVFLGAILMLLAFVVKKFNVVTPEQAVIIFSIGVILAFIAPIMYFLGIDLFRK